MTKPKNLPTLHDLGGPYGGGPYAGYEHEERMLVWHGLRPTKARPCLRVLRGQRCISGYSWTDNCLCATVQRRNVHPMFDQVRIWLDQDGRHVLTIEPYGFPTPVEEFTRKMAELGIA